MPSITFVTAGGTRYTVQAATDTSLMEAALEHDVPGIDADCGGNASCATCRLDVGTEWWDRLPAQDDIEKQLLSFAENVTATTRLSCQIPVTDALDGMVVVLPASQK